MSVSRNTVRGASKTRYLSRRMHRRGVEGTVKRGSQRRVRAFWAAKKALEAQGWSV